MIVYAYIFSYYVDAYIYAHAYMYIYIYVIIFFTLIRSCVKVHTVIMYVDKYALVISVITSIDVLPPKNQALYEFCTRVNQLKHC